MLGMVAVDFHVIANSSIPQTRKCRTVFYPLGAKLEAIKHATSTGIMRYCENNLEQGSRIQDVGNLPLGVMVASFEFFKNYNALQGMVC